MQLTIVAVFWTLFAIVHCKQYDASYLEEISGKMESESSTSNANQPKYGAKARSSIVSFKRGEEHKVAGVLLTVKHAVAVLVYIIYLKRITPLDFIEVGACFEPPRTHYPIAKLSYDREEFPSMDADEKKNQLGIVTLVDEVQKSSHGSPITAHVLDGSHFEEHLYIIGLDEAGECIQFPFHRENMKTDLEFIDDNIQTFDKYTASKFLFRKDHLQGYATDLHNSHGHQRISFERFDTSYDEIKNWLWKNSDVSILGDWLTQEEKSEDPATNRPCYRLNYILWDGRDKVDGTRSLTKGRGKRRIKIRMGGHS